MNVPFFPHTSEGGWKNSPTATRTDEWREWISIATRSTCTLYISVSDSDIRIVRERSHDLSPLSTSYYIFATRMASSFSTPFAISPPRFFLFLFSNLRSEIPSGYCSPSPSARIHRVFSRADPFKQGSRQIGEGLVLVK